MINYEDLDRAFARCEFQAEVLLQGSNDVWAEISRFRNGTALRFVLAAACQPWWC